jgi:isoleucyl-tRNA synthetase
MSPILPFTSEEAWDILSDFKEKSESVHLEQFPRFEEKWLESDVYQEWESLVDVREKVLKEIELAREKKLIGNSLEVRLTLHVPKDQLVLLKKYQGELPNLFIVSEVELKSGAGEEMIVDVEKASGEKCQRCWNFSSYVGTSQQFPLFCKRCEDVVERMNL